MALKGMEVDVETGSCFAEIVETGEAGGTQSHVQEAKRACRSPTKLSKVASRGLYLPPSDW
jgi:hypothetical protein